MKILQVTNLFAPVHGGSAEAPYQLSKQLAKMGHEVTLYTSDFKLSHEYIVSVPEVKVHAFKTWLNLANFYITPGIIGRARKEVEHFDVIHMHNYRSFQNIAVQCYAQKHKIPYILQAHGSIPRIMGKKTLKQLFDSLWGYKLLKNAAKVIAVTKAEAEQYENMGVNEDRIRVIPHGINLSEFDTLPERGTFRQKYGLDSNLKVILYLGRIHKIKGLDLLASAFAEFSQLSKNVKLVITGPDDGYLSTLKQLIKRLEIEERVLFTGPLYGQDKLRAYVDADVYVLPSNYEIFGITILEAWACGTPVIVTDSCGLADVVENRAGLVIPYNKERLRDALLYILGDARIGCEFSKKGKQLVYEEFNWEKVTKEIEILYRGTQN